MVNYITSQHPVLKVKFDDDDMLDAQTQQWFETGAVHQLDVVEAWFERGPDGEPQRSPDGTYIVHVPQRRVDLLGALKERLLPHEHLVVVDEWVAQGSGIEPSNQAALLGEVDDDKNATHNID